jgi:hypothetical protein
MQKPILGALLIAGASLVAQADGPQNGELISVDASYVFAPRGFDDNDETVVVIDGYLPSGCFRLTRPETTVDQETKTISITPFARFFDIPCIEARIPYSQEIRLGVLAEGDYEVVVKTSAVSESLSVAESTNAGPDDYLYAPVDAVNVERDPETGKLTAVLEGRFTDRCMEWDEVEVADDGATVVLLPKMAMRDDDSCGAAELPFKKRVDLPETIAEGRHLLHVRSLNGQAVNSLFTKFD